MDIAGLIQEGAKLKEEINRKNRVLRAIHEKIADACEFGGKKTARIAAGGYDVRVTRRENVRWDQERLALIREHYDFFDSVFRREYRPRDQRRLEAAMDVDPTFREAVEWSRTVREGAPSVEYARKKVAAAALFDPCVL